MNTKLQELTDKIYQEGVERGNAEAQKIVDNARDTASGIVAEAQAEAEKILAEARDKAAELTKNTQAELRLFARQSVDALKTEIADLVCGTVATESVKAATADAAFMQKAILTLVKDWAKHDQLTIEAKDAEALTAYIRDKAKKLLTEGLKIEKVAGRPAAFSISPADGSYRVDFGFPGIPAPEAGGNAVLICHLPFTIYHLPT